MSTNQEPAAAGDGLPVEGESKRRRRRPNIDPQYVAELHYLNTAQLGALLGVAGVTLELWRRSGCGPAFSKVGHRVIYDRREVDKWLASNRRGGQ